MIDDTLQDRVRKIINRHDPVGLLKMGAPTDEYDSELKRIIPLLSEVGSRDELHEKVYQLFVEMFRPATVGSKAQYAGLSEELYQLSRIKP